MKPKSLPLCVVLLTAVFGFVTHANAQTVTGSVPSPVRDTILDILKEADIGSADLTSHRRSTREEAAWLYNHLQAYEGSWPSLIKHHKPPVAAVFEVYRKHKTDSRETVLALLNTELQQQIARLGDNRSVFRLVGPSKTHIYDVKLTPTADRSRFEAALLKHPDVVRWMKPRDNDGAYQIEISRLMRTISGLWRGRCRETVEEGEGVRYRHVMKLFREKNGYRGIRKAPTGPHRDEKWMTSPLLALSIDRRTKKITYSYQNEHGQRVDIVGKFNDIYSRIKFEKNTGNAKCRLRKRF